MITLKIISEQKIYKEKAQTMEQLKRIVLDNYDVKGFKFCLDNELEKPETFSKFFKGVKSTKKI